MEASINGWDLYTNSFSGGGKLGFQYFKVFHWNTLKYFEVFLNTWNTLKYLWNTLKYFEILHFYSVKRRKHLKKNCKYSFYLQNKIFFRNLIIGCLMLAKLDDIFYWMFLYLKSSMSYVDFLTGCAYFQNLACLMLMSSLDVLISKIQHVLCLFPHWMCLFP